MSKTRDARIQKSTQHLSTLMDLWIARNLYDAKRNGASIDSRASRKMEILGILMYSRGWGPRQSRVTSMRYYHKPLCICVTHQFFTFSAIPLLHLVGLILGPMRSDMTCKHLHCIPLNMSFIFLEDISCWKTLKIALFPLVQFHSVALVPMGEILQIGRSSWHSVIESHSHQR